MQKLICGDRGQNSGYLCGTVFDKGLEKAF